MLNEKAFANALAILTGAVYLVFYILGLSAPNTFKALFNAQFLGADVASLLPKDASLGNVFGVFVTLVVTAWLMGFVWALLYNRFSEKR